MKCHLYGLRIAQRVSLKCTQTTFTFPFQCQKRGMGMMKSLDHDSYKGTFERMPQQSLEKLKFIPPSRSVDSSRLERLQAEEFESKLRKSLGEEVASKTGFPETEEEIKNWISKSLEAYAIFNANKNKFADKQLEVDDILRNYTDSQIELLEGLNMNFEKFIAVLKRSGEILDLKDLQACVLALGCWPPQFTGGWKSYSHNIKLRNHSQLHEIYEILEGLSCRRLYIFHVKSTEFYVSDVLDRLQLANVWAQVLSKNEFSKNKFSKIGSKRGSDAIFDECKSNTFPNQLVRKVCNKSGGCSHRFFSKLDHNSFVEFMRMLNYLMDIDSEEFHRYYVCFKTFQLMPQLSLEQLSIVCRASLKHGLIIYSRHPIGFAIGDLLADKMLCDFDKLDSETLSTLSWYLGEHFCQPSIAAKVIKVQEKVTEKMLVEPDCFDLNALTSLCFASFPTEKPFPKFARVIAESFILSNPSDFGSFHILLKLISLCHLNAFGDLQDSVIDKIVECYRRFIETYPLEGQNKDKVLLVLHLAYENRFHDDILTDLFLDTKFCTRDKKSNRLKFKSSLEYSDLYMHLTYRTAIKIIQSLVELHYPKYKGPKFDTDLFEKYCGHLQIMLPSRLKDAHSVQIMNWKMVGKHIQESIAEEIETRFKVPKIEALEKYVLETSVLPCFSTANYVCVLDSDFKIAPIPEDFIGLPLGYIKKPLINEKTHKYWITITFFDSSKNCAFGRMLNSYKFLHITEALNLGFHRIMSIDMDTYHSDLTKLRDDEVLQQITKETKSFFENALNPTRQQAPVLELSKTDFLFLRATS